MTIHAALYNASVDEAGHIEFRINRAGPAAKAKLIVIDEVSMVDEQVGRDLLSLGKPILVLGDPAQLPPVKGAGFFTNVAKPNTMLTEIHRQARDNAIIRFATDVREGRPLPFGTFGQVEIGRRGQRGAAEVLEADQILVGRNSTRTSFNARIRKHLGRPSVYPQVGDRLVCLKNDGPVGIFNGGLFEVASLMSASARDTIGLRVRSEDFPTRAPIPVKVRTEFFDGDGAKVDWRLLRDTQQFDYGYALTCHKAQGSQWRHVLAYDESEIFGQDARRWLYTAITRASERLTLVR
jgi:exodeoxyribonuclease-5